MKKYYLFTGFMSLLLLSKTGNAQNSKDPIINSIVEEATKNSQLEQLAFELLDEIGPRLIGSPQMKIANDWVVNTYKKWGINAENQQYGTWRGWERGITHVDLLTPRVKTLEAIQLAWSPNVKKGFQTEIISLPIFKDSMELVRWLPNVKGKAVLISPYQFTGRSDEQWKEFALPIDYQNYLSRKDKETAEWSKMMKSIGYNNNTLPPLLEKAGATAIILNNWTGVMGANKVFAAKTKHIPTVDIANEDYGMLYRLVNNGKSPKINIHVTSKHTGATPVFNTIATIPGTEKPNEYVFLSAHLDSWDAGQGATDNGTGTITMMEAARILKKVLPNPKRTIIIGHWNGEEQGLNGSRAYIEDHPEIVKNTIALFNQDNGTGRIVSINGQGFEQSYAFLGRWLQAIPNEYSNYLKPDFPGLPSNGGSDNAAFIAAGVPAFYLSALPWGYRTYTWHTNRDTYDKIIFEEVKRNAIVTAILVYQAAQDTATVSKQQIIMPLDKDGKTTKWPTPHKSNRTGEGY